MLAQSQASYALRLPTSTSSLLKSANGALKLYCKKFIARRPEVQLEDLARRGSSVARLETQSTRDATIKLALALPKNERSC